MARKRKGSARLLDLALTPYAGALVSTRSKMLVKLVEGGGSPNYVAPTYWEWGRGHPLLFVGVETESRCTGGTCRGWLKVITPQGYGWVSPSAATQLDLVSESAEPTISPTGSTFLEEA